MIHRGYKCCIVNLSDSQSESCRRLWVGIVLIIGYLLITPITEAQNSDEKAIQLMDKAIGKAIESNNIAISFEGIAYGLKDPKSIFVLPMYEVKRGGFLFIDGEKMEMQLGAMKSLSDGKLVVVVDEVSKTIFVDSVRNHPLIKTDAPIDIAQLFKENFGEGNMSYEGEETINGRKCYKIKSSFDYKEKNHVYYWIEKNSEKLYLMAEWQNNAYDVYWLKSIDSAPQAHEYAINLPKKELEQYYGYNVIDQRFARELLRDK